MAFGLGPDTHGCVTIAEVAGIVLLNGDDGVEMDVFGLVSDAEAASPH
jgi:hypothetical protein